MICVEEYGDYIRPKQIVRSNRICYEHKLCYSLQGELMPKVYYRVNKYNFYTLDCITHIKKNSYSFWFFCFVLFLVVALLDLFDMGKK
jgi:hypothetical protein